MVDVSLEGLKNSYQKLSDQNRLLASRIEEYREHIQSLRQELALLESRQAELSGILRDPAGTNVAPPEVVYRQDIEQLTEKIDGTSEKAMQKAFQQKKGELDMALEQSRKNLRATRLDVKTIREQVTVGAAIAQLKARQAQLQRQLADRQSAVKLESAKAYADQLDKEIAKLKLRQRELEKKLSHALGEESSDISRFTEENYQLRRRFVALRDENMRLKKEMSLLEALSVPPRP